MQRQKQRECNTQALEYSSMDRNRENTTHRTQQHGQKQREYNTQNTAAWTETERMQHTEHSSMDRNRENATHNLHIQNFIKNPPFL